MSIRFDLKGRTLLPTRGKVFIRPHEKDDWGPSSQEAMRFTDRGSLNDPVETVEDWGRLPSATV